MKSELSIKTKITLFMVLFISLVLAAFSMLVINAGRGIILDEVRQRGVIISTNLASNISGYLLTSATLDSIKLLSNTRESKGVVYALVTDETNRIIAHNDTNLIGSVFEPDKASKKDRTVQWSDIRVSGMKVLDFTAPVTANKGIFLGNVHIGMSYVLIEKMLWKMYSLLIIISVISLIVAISGAVALGIAFTKPIGVLADGARKMGEGDLGYRVKIDSGDEFGLLAESLNNMARDLKNAHDAEIDIQKFKVEKLREVNEIKSNFISIVSHELRTPLAVIKAVISFFNKGSLGPVSRKQADFIETMSNNTKRLELLVNDLVDISMIEKGEFPVIKIRFDINALIREIVRDMAGLMSDSFITLTSGEDPHTRGNAPEVFIDADRGRLAQALTNLINNAAKFSSRGTAVKAGVITGNFDPESKKRMEMAGQTREYIVIYVKDEGIGLEKSQLGKIFERFYQVEHPDTRSRGGIGMGLTITENIVKLNDGEIWAESEGIGKGSTFKILIPRAI